MVVLRASLLLIFTSCYTPDFAACTVACRSDAACAPGHVCGPRALCAPRGETCADDDPRDGPLALIDAPPDAPPDAATPPPTGILRIDLRDHGIVHVAGVGACDAAFTMRCDFVVELDVPRTLTAIPHPDHRFDKWNHACRGELPTCIVTPNEPVTRVEARFRRSDHDD